MAKKKKNITAADQNASAAKDKSANTKKKRTLSQRILSGVYYVMLKPIFTFIKKHITLFDDINQSIIQKITAILFFVFAGLMAYTVFIGLGLLIAAAFVDFAHWSWISAILAVLPFHIVMMLIIMLIGNSLLHKPILKRKEQKDDK